MPHVYAAAASPLGRALLLAEEERTKGGKAVFAVVLMFTILCGGVWLLLQSNFGPWQGYLITGTAFFGSWLVLSVFWLTGVPGFTLGPVKVPTSTPRFLGPQGDQATWVVLNTPQLATAHAVPEAELVEATADITDQTTTAEVTNAKGAVAEDVASHYAKETGAEASALLENTTWAVTKVEIVRQDRRVAYARVTTGQAPTVPATATEEQKTLRAKLKPATFDLWYDRGSLEQPTYIAVALFTVLFLLHAVLLGLAEIREQDREKALAPA